jgi:hypothetical protein
MKPEIVGRCVIGVIHHSNIRCTEFNENLYVIKWKMHVRTQTVFVILDI